MGYLEDEREHYFKRDLQRKLDQLRALAAEMDKKIAVTEFYCTLQTLDGATKYVSIVGRPPPRLECVLPRSSFPPQLISGSLDELQCPQLKTRRYLLVTADFEKRTAEYREVE